MPLARLPSASPAGDGCYGAGAVWCRRIAPLTPGDWALLPRDALLLRHPDDAPEGRRLPGLRSLDANVFPLPGSRGSQERVECPPRTSARPFRFLVERGFDSR